MRATAHGRGMPTPMAPAAPPPPPPPPATRLQAVQPVHRPLRRPREPPPALPRRPPHARPPAAGAGAGQPPRGPVPPSDPPALRRAAPRVPDPGGRGVPRGGRVRRRAAGRAPRAAAVPHGGGHGAAPAHSLGPRVVPWAPAHWRCVCAAAVRLPSISPVEVGDRGGGGQRVLRCQAGPQSPFHAPQPPPTATSRQPPTATSRHPPPATRQPPPTMTATRPLPPTATNRHSPPANRHQP